MPPPKKLLENMRKLISKLFPVGTRSVLWGVHNFIWHPWTVARAWRHIYGVWPTVDEWICIFCHDTFGYWGCPNMDGAEGKRHPEVGAAWAFYLVAIRNWLCLKPEDEIGERARAAEKLTLYHSSHYARLNGEQPSALYLPDKASILFEPRWWYLLRARLSGEVREYISNSPFARLSPELQTPGAWYSWYKSKVKQKLESKNL